MFQDGTPANAQAVKDSYTRWIELEGSPVNVITRFCDSPDKMEVVDDTTLRFNLGSPQPLFLAAMASAYGPIGHQSHGASRRTPLMTIRTRMSGPRHLPWAVVPTFWNRTRSTRGSSSTKFDGYHRGWEGNHFDEIIFRVVPEDATRRQLLERGEADAAAYNLTLDAVDALRSNPDVQVVEYPITAVSWIDHERPAAAEQRGRGRGSPTPFPMTTSSTSSTRG